VTVPTGQYVPGLHAEQVVLPIVPYVLTEQRDMPARCKRNSQKQKTKSH
jgi:hypothetical protein